MDMALRIASLVATASALAGCATPDPRSNVSKTLETPAFAVTAIEGNFEVRRYEPLIVAQTIVEGDREAATRDGFRRLAGYIFGGNTARASVSVTSERIAMTAPVAAQPTDTQGGAAWAVTFTMPRHYTLETLPTPDDARVRLVPVEGRMRAAVVFAGTTSPDTVEEKARELRAWIEARGLVATSAPELARYNDPWTLPWNRRNEVLIDVATAPDGPG
jgi:hypothetical protein